MENNNGFDLSKPLLIPEIGDLQSNISHTTLNPISTEDLMEAPLGGLNIKYFTDASKRQALKPDNTAPMREIIYNLTRKIEHKKLAHRFFLSDCSLTDQNRIVWKSYHAWELETESLWDTGVDYSAHFFGSWSWSSWRLPFNQHQYTISSHNVYSNGTALWAYWKHRIAVARPKSVDIGWPWELESALSRYIQTRSSLLLFRT